MLTVLLIVLLILAFAGLPNWGFATNYGFSGIIGLLLVILLVMMITGNVNF